MSAIGHILNKRGSVKVEQCKGNATNFLRFLTDSKHIDVIRIKIACSRNGPTHRRNGLVPKLPAFLEEKAELSTEDANKTRLVASIRWVVEAFEALSRHQVQSKVELEMSVGLKCDLAARLR
ncbi:hypothetical protein TNCV_3171511 [Trichonephila clavipes]|nr:hypothetical protein TNCV_3171511 [Trichonephila clavipes]